MATIMRFLADWRIY